VRVDKGVLDVGQGHRLRWECVGPPAALPVIVLHGGPGSGVSPWYLRWFDPLGHRVVLFDQRNCGGSTPYAGDATVDLSTNTTPALVADMERLRTHLGIKSWLVAGASWGTVLGLAYAQAHPDRVLAMVLNSTATCSSAEVEWITRGMGQYFPDEWARFVSALPSQEQSGNLAAAFNGRLMSPDPAVHGPAAAAWCAWEETHVATDGRSTADPRYADPQFRLCFARIVTHYWMNHAFLPDGQILKRMSLLAQIPSALVHGRRDLSSPASVATAVHEAWPGSRLTLLDDVGHGGTLDATRDAVAQVTARAHRRT
jgi:proline iminopeptidase